jgi:GTP:adenosylcobinamide-phosphate guanylyltransferase
MRLIAFRPEYQLTVEDDKNRLFYQNFGQMQRATCLPDYIEDWKAALSEVSPGFSILSDMQVVNQTSHDLRSKFQAVEQLIVQRGVSMVAEVHVPGLPTRRSCDAVTTAQVMPVRQFLNIWEAAQFLDDL